MRCYGCYVALAVALAGAGAGPAFGQSSGNGLYEPFPQGESRAQAERFVERLPSPPNAVGGRVAARELEAGRFVAGGNQADAGDAGPGDTGRASLRAGRGDSLESAPGLPLELALVVIAVAAPVLIVVALRRGRRLGPLAAAGALGVAVVLGVSAGIADDGGSRALEPEARDRPSADFAGVVAPELFEQDRPGRERAIGRMRAAGVGLVRQTLDWRLIERAPGAYDWSRYDELVAQLARERIRILPILFNAPRFRSRRPERAHAPGFNPPRLGTIGAFAASAARRYGPGGRFWQERPELPRLHVRAWQVWNEPNLDFYWGGHPDAGEYLTLLRAARKAIRSVDTQAEIVSAGIAQSDLGVPAAEFITQLHRAGGRSAFDTLAIHAYSRDIASLLDALRSTRRLMRRHGDERPLWLTEFGWATGGPLSDFTVSEPRQAALIARAIRALRAERARLGLRGLVYFRWRDAPAYAGGRDFFGLHTGLLRADGRAKPGLRAFRAASSGGHSAAP